MVGATVVSGQCNCGRWSVVVCGGLWWSVVGAWSVVSGFVLRQKPTQET